jgi:hypothetical protein
MKKLLSVIRQTHMYLGLFLAPWMLIYALSTMAMNHREYFKERYGGTMVKWEVEKEQTLTPQFKPDSSAQEMATSILQGVNQYGNFNANLTRDRQKLTINRSDPVTPRRFTYTPSDGKLVIEKQEFRSEPFLEGLHRRRGFQSSFTLDKLWGASVDLVIIAMVLWVISGVWVWWEMKPTRRAGLVWAGGGLALFALFLFSI